MHITENEKYSKLRPPNGSSDFLYTIDNRWDLKLHTTNPNSLERTIALRLPQLVEEITVAFIVCGEDEHAHLLDIQQKSSN